MAKSRKVRFENLADFYGAFTEGLNNEESTRKNIQYQELFVYESEVEKFAEKFPEVPMEDTDDKLGFMSFAEHFGAVKRKGSGGGGSRGTSLDSVEKAKQIGVKDEDIPQYQALVKQIFDLRNELNKLCPDGSVSFSIPVRKKKDDNTSGEVVEAAEETAEAPE